MRVLFNAFKHHAGFLRERIARWTLEEAAAEIVVIGHALMDLYTGPMPPDALSSWVMDELGGMDRDEFAAWLAERGDYATLTHPEGTAWVLRLGEGERWVHLHPGRHSPNTVRVQANVLKTAILARVHGDAMRLETVNAVRREWLGLPPLKEAPREGVGLGAVIAVLTG